MKRKNLIVASGVFVIGLLLFLVLVPRIMTIGVSGEELVTIPGGSVDEPTIEVHDRSLRFSLKKQTEKQWSSAKDERFIYDVHKGRKNVADLTVTRRTLSNGDVLYFTKLENHQEEPLQLNLSLLFEDESNLTMQAFSTEGIDHSHDSTYGVDPTTIPTGLLNVGEKRSLYLGKNYESKVLLHEYENGDTSKVRELVEERDPYRVDESKLHVRVTSSEKGVTENWMLWSDHSLFKSKQALESWKQYNQTYFKSVQKWLTPTGALIKLPWSIEPVTKLGYGRNIGSLSAEEMLERYQDSGERFFESMTLNTLTSVEAYRADKGTKLWKTEYTSTWVKKSYGVHAPYTDTRHNEKLALFLIEAAETFDLPHLKQEGLLYADYLVKQAEQGNTISFEKDAFLIADYDGPGMMTTPHASLNHALGEAYYLLQAYEISGNEAYLELAYSMRKGIEAIGQDWIRQEGSHREDMWYQVNANHTFSGNDYQLLTLIDLHKNQDAWAETKYGKSEVFARLIASKTSYLERTGLDVEKAVQEKMDIK
ncbi:hypothetical protein [Pontibacillus marinus]|uniref:D-glucuronyl C5-epimerase C-terminal domain-containing protein n=1 Tax=Pontibacillus marinus BH030004 = DSM 16465 TaxID=1385511 RepID=A0A0A5GIJ8_9BACI|nr:hypothetical protein [Pontibacillus marinus]KGX91023.1 hypothetical protein N783_13340 [Pontibacillus marinus BH030004 = DSM 16465]